MMNKQLILRILAMGIALLGSNILCKPRASFSMPKSSMRIAKPKSAYTAPKSYSSQPKTYTQKPAYAGLGKTSKVNGLPKSHIISGHTKRTSKGYKLVNPYARSK